MGCIYRSDSCYLHQSRFPGRSLCYIDGIAFVTVVTAVVAVLAAVLSEQDNHVVH
jgi:hypothetical protein